MKKQTLIVIILCLLVAAVIVLSVLGIVGPQEGEPGSFAGSSKAIPTVSPENTDPSYDNNDRDFAIPTYI